MKAGDLTDLAVRNLREAGLRNSLTTLGIAVGVASIGTPRRFFLIFVIQSIIAIR